MPQAPLREACELLYRTPLLWIPGIINGFLASVFFILLSFSGTFFASRIMVFSVLVYLFFITGMLVVLKGDGTGFHDMISGAFRYYFRVLIPQLVIGFGILLILLILTITLAFASSVPDMSMISFLMICIMIPVILFTFFFNTAAVFEDRRAFDSIQRSIRLVSNNFTEALIFFIVVCALVFDITFSMTLIWEAALFPMLEPLTHYTETQLKVFTPDNLVAMIGPDGLWITGIIVFFGIFLLVPLLYTYKACYFKAIAGRHVVIQQLTG